VASGRKGAMSGDRWLIGNYDPSFYGVLEKYLRCEDERIRAETVSLLAAVRERAALPEIRRMRAREGERVAMACLGYLSAAEESDSLIPELFDILEHKRGAEFERAAVRMRSAGRSEDVPRLRRIYGQVEGGMRDSLRRALESIADRDETLRGKKDLILSVPVYPDREAFSSFLERSIDYLDVRYRGNVHPLRTVEKGTYNNPGPPGDEGPPVQRVRQPGDLRSGGERGVRRACRPGGLGQRGPAREEDGGGRQGAEGQEMPPVRRPDRHLQGPDKLSRVRFMRLTDRG